MALLWVTAAGYLDDEDAGPFFHASSHDFDPGDYVVPPGKRGITYEHPKGEEWRNDRVFLTKDPDNAMRWMENTSKKVNVYEVEPVGVKHHEPTNYDLAYDDPDFPHHDQYQARGARVIRKVR